MKNSILEILKTPGQEQYALSFIDQMDDDTRAIILANKENFKCLIDQFKQSNQERQLLLTPLLKYWVKNALDFTGICQVIHERLYEYLLKNKQIPLLNFLFDFIADRDEKNRTKITNTFLNEYLITSTHPRTPIMLAATEGSLAVCELLLARGAIESAFTLENYPSEQMNALGLIFRNSLAELDHQRALVFFKLWMSGAIIKFSYFTRFTTKQYYSTLFIASLLPMWLRLPLMEYLLVHEEFLDIDELTSDSKETPYSFLLKNYQQSHLENEKKSIKRVLTILEKKGANIDGYRIKNLAKANEKAEVSLVTLCEQGKIAEVKEQLAKPNINLALYVVKPAFIAAIFAYKKPHLREQSLQIMNLLFQYDRGCVKYACKKGTMAVTYAALWGMSELLENLILKFKAPVNPIASFQKPPIQDLIHQTLGMGWAMSDFKKNGQMSCLKLLIEVGSDLDFSLEPHWKETARAYLDDFVVDILSIEQNSISAERILHCSLLSSQFRAAAREEFLLSRYLQGFFNLPSSSQQPVDHEVFNIAPICNLIASYARFLPDSKKCQSFPGPDQRKVSAILCSR